MKMEQPEQRQPMSWTCPDRASAPPYSRRARTICTALMAVVGLFIAGCGNTDSSRGSTALGTTTPAAQQSPTAPARAASTRALDSIVVLGHSGTTGYNSDPTRPNTDAPENSWATGTNPKVDSIYRRLLATHPALKGHTTSLGIDGSTVDDLAAQVDSMLSLDPLPDVVIIQTVDNDIRCDGTDLANEKAFAKTLSDVLTTINRNDRYAQVFFVDQWGSVAMYAEATKNLPAAVAASSGTGPCDTFTASGRLQPAGVASLQRIVDGYYGTVERVCAEHRACWTDRGALKRISLTPADLTPDLDHLSLKGLPVMASFAWSAMPRAIKDRP